MLQSELQITSGAQAGIYTILRQNLCTQAFSHPVFYYACRCFLSIASLCKGKLQTIFQWQKIISFWRPSLLLLMSLIFPYNVYQMDCKMFKFSTSAHYQAYLSIKAFYLMWLLIWIIYMNPTAYQCHLVTNQFIFCLQCSLERTGYYLNFTAHFIAFTLSSF